MGWARPALNSYPNKGIRLVVRKRTTKITIIEPRRAALGMAKSKTGSFWLTEVVECTTDSVTVQGTIDLGAYVDVGDQQALAIEQVDFIFQRKNATDDYSPEVEIVCSLGPGVADVQITDLNPSSLMVRADDNTLIASGALHIDGANYVVTPSSDFFPDNFGKLDESRMVVNDNLYMVGELNATVGAGETLVIAARIKARIVKLSTKDWMAIAIQSTAADN